MRDTSLSIRKLTVGVTDRDQLVHDADAAWSMAQPPLIRFGIYTLLLLSTMAGLLRLLMVEESFEHLYFGENGIVEWTQFACIALGALLLVAAALRHPVSRPVLMFAGCLMAVAACRELDSFLGRWNPLWGWRVPAALFVGLAVVVAWRAGRHFVSQAVRWIYTPSFGLFWAGFVIVVIFAQLMGQADLWKGIMGDQYERVFKRVVEESAELFGYVLILLAAAETWFQAPMMNRSPDHNKTQKD